MTSVPFVDLAAQQGEVLEELRPLVEQVLATAGFVGGPHVEQFERAYADLAGVRHCIGVANGTDALELALRAVGVTADSEVILPANTFIATAEAVARIGAVPVLVDVDPHAFLIDPAKLRAAITARTRAIVPVHLYGQLAPMEDVMQVARQAGVAVVEDAAQAQGATRGGVAAGAFGDAAGTSFYPGKNLGAAGDAGAVLTSVDDLARDVRMMSNHGSEQKYVHDVVGFNSRLDALQAAVLKVKLGHLEGWNRARRVAAERYGQMLADLERVTAPVTLDGNEHVWHLYVVQVDDRDRVLAALHQAGIGAALHYPTPVHLTKAFAHLGYGPGDFPVTEAAATTLLSLPMFPHLTADQQWSVVSGLRSALSAGASTS